MCFLYILPWLHKSSFKRVLQRSVRIGFGSGCVRRWFGTSTVVPGPLSGCPWRAVLFDSDFVRSCRAVGFRRLPAAVCSWSAGGSRDSPGRNKNTKEMYDKSETASKPGRFELGKSEKNRRNLKLIQTCDFFILCILYIIFYNVSRRDVNFSF